MLITYSIDISKIHKYAIVNCYFFYNSYTVLHSFLNVALGNPIFMGCLNAE